MDKLPYQFYDNEREIRFDRFDLPSPWINYLSNGRLHAFVSQAGGGMCWWLSPMMFRVSRYRFYNMPMTRRAFIFIFVCPTARCGRRRSALAKPRWISARPSMHRVIPRLLQKE